MNAEKKTVSTSTLMRRLSKTSNISRFIEANAEVLQVPFFHEYISEKCNKMGETPEKIILRAGLDRVYGHQIFQGIRKPSRDKVIQLAFGFGLDVDETQELLCRAQHSMLYPKIKRDAAILFCIQRKQSFMDMQDLLDELGLTLLGGR